MSNLEFDKLDSEQGEVAFISDREVIHVQLAALGVFHISRLVHRQKELQQRSMCVNVCENDWSTFVRGLLQCEDRRRRVD